MKKIKIAQIGITHEHAPGKYATLKNMPETYELVGVYNDMDTYSTPAFYTASLLNAYKDANWMSLDEILNYPDLDAVAVEVPNNELVPIAMRCMERGLAMHMDKPAGEDLTLYKKLLDGCQAKKLPFQMGYMFRGNPAFQFCIKAIREKLIGDVVEILTDMNHNYGGEPYQEYIGKFPGGIMYNLGCHLIDFIVAAMGRPESAASFMKSAPGCASNIFNNCTAVLEYPTAHVILRSCSKVASCTPGRSMIIAGTKGTIQFSPLERFDNVPLEVSLMLKEARNGYPAGSHTLRFPMDSDRYRPQLQELAEVIRGEREQTYSYEHDYIVHEVTLAACGLHNL